MRIQSVQALARRELARRRSGQGEVSTADITAALFIHQIEAIRAPGRYRSWCCTRRAGKTVALMVALILAALENAESTCVYLSTSIKRAVRTCWGELRKLLRKYKIPHKVNVTDHAVTFPNGSVIYISGCETKTEADAWRGYPRTALWAVDECQDWKPELLMYLMGDVIAPSLADVGGRVIQSGTPGHVMAGAWYQACHSDDVVHAKWSLFDNPHIKDAQQTLEDACKLRGCTLEDASIQREFFGRWVVDAKKAVFPAELQIAQPAGPTSGKVSGVDVGVVDNTAVVSIEYTASRAYITAGDQRTGLGAEAQQAFVASLTAGAQMVLLDPGGGGKALLQDFQTMGMANYVGAEKQEKDAGLRRLRDAIRSGRLVAVGHFPTLELAMKLVQWHPDGRGILGHMPDIIDALLYAWRYVERFMPGVDESVFVEKTHEQLEQDQLLERQEELRRAEQERYV